MNRTITIVLIILALALGAGAIYFGYQLTQEETTPDTSVAGESCGTASGCAICGTDGSCNWCCGGGGTQLCSTDAEWTNGYNICNGSPVGTCAASVITPEKDGFTLNSFCSNVTVKILTKDYTGESEKFYPGCVTTEGTTGVTSRTETAGAGSSYQAYKPGKCVQIDVESIGLGVCRCVPAEPTCGDGKLNQTSEQCEVGIACSGTNVGKKCNTSTCLCTTVTAKATCGDGVINQDAEECEVGIECDEGSMCNTTSCLCEEIPATCGNGVIDTGEYCDPTATPAGCLTGETCSTSCRCSSYIPVANDLPKTAIINDETDKLLYAALAIVGGLLLLQFNVKGFVLNAVKKASNYLQTGSFAYITSPLSQKAKEEIVSKRKEKFEKRVGK